MVRRTLRRDTITCRAAAGPAPGPHALARARPGAATRSAIADLRTGSIRHRQHCRQEYRHCRSVRGGWLKVDTLRR